MASTYIYRTPSSTGSNTISTFSAWLKKTVNGAYEGIFTSVYETGEYFEINFETGDALEVRAKVSSSYVLRKITTRKFRDNSAFYHIVVAIDTTDGTAEDRVKIYVNGVRETSFSTNTNPGSSQNLYMNTAGSWQHRLGRDEWSTPAYFDGVMAHVHWVDGIAYQASTFGETDSTSGIWKPKLNPTVTYGTNGFFFKFENSGNMDLDSSGNNLTFTTGGTLTQNVDTPSNNFATLNPLHATGNSTLPALTNGNLTYTGHSGTSYSGTYSTLAASSGKYYAEFKCTGGGGAGDMMIGAGNGITNTTAPGASSNDLVVFGYDGKYYNGGSGVSWGGSSWTSGDIIGVAMDLDNNKLYVSKNGTYMNSGNPTSGSSGTGALTLATSTTGVYHFLLGDYGGDGTPICESNFGSGYFGTTQVASANADANGHGAFEYAVPSGYYALNTKNIKEYG